MKAWSKGTCKTLLSLWGSSDLPLRDWKRQECFRVWPWDMRWISDLLSGRQKRRTRAQALEGSISEPSSSFWSFLGLPELQRLKTCIFDLYTVTHLQCLFFPHPLIHYCSSKTLFLQSSGNLLEWTGWVKGPCLGYGGMLSPSLLPYSAPCMAMIYGVFVSIYQVVSSVVVRLAASTKHLTKWNRHCSQDASSEDGNHSPVCPVHSPPQPSWPQS
jgi:hypothetical protein